MRARAKADEPKPLEWLLKDSRLTLSFEYISERLLWWQFSESAYDYMARHGRLETLLEQLWYIHRNKSEADVWVFIAAVRGGWLELVQACLQDSRYDLSDWVLEYATSSALDSGQREVIVLLIREPRFKHSYIPFYETLHDALKELEDDPEDIDALATFSFFAHEPCVRTWLADPWWCWALDAAHEYLREHQKELTKTLETYWDTRPRTIKEYQLIPKHSQLSTNKHLI